MTNVWYLFEYVAYAFAPKKSATIESHLSSFSIAFHAGSSWTLLILFWVMLSKESLVRMPTPVTKQPFVGLWEMLVAGETLISTWQTGVRVLWLAFCASFCFLTRA